MTLPVQLVFNNAQVTINSVDLAPVLAALADIKTQGATMTDALSNLQAAEAALDAEVTALAAEQATFLADIAAALANAGTDPATPPAAAEPAPPAA